MKEAIMLTDNLQQEYTQLTSRKHLRKVVNGEQTLHAFECRGPLPRVLYVRRAKQKNIEGVHGRSWGYELSMPVL